MTRTKKMKPKINAFKKFTLKFPQIIKISPFIHLNNQD